MSDHSADASHLPQPIEEMQGKMLIAVCNLKPASMRGIKSFAMVLAVSGRMNPLLRTRESIVAKI